MERRAEDIEADPILRQEYVSQESFDEWMERMCQRLEERGQAELAKKLREYNYSEAVEMWMRTIDPNTNVSEVAYLQGFTELNTRRALLAQKHAQLREAALEMGVLTREDFAIDGIVQDRENGQAD